MLMDMQERRLWANPAFHEYMVERAKRNHRSHPPQTEVHITAQEHQDEDISDVDSLTSSLQSEETARLPLNSVSNDVFDDETEERNNALHASMCEEIGFQPLPKAQNVSSELESLEVGDGMSRLEGATGSAQSINPTKKPSRKGKEPAEMDIADCVNNQPSCDIPSPGCSDSTEGNPMDEYLSEEGERKEDEIIVTTTPYILNDPEQADIADGIPPKSEPEAEDRNLDTVDGAAWPSLFGPDQTTLVGSPSSSSSSSSSDGETVTNEVADNEVTAVEVAENEVVEDEVADDELTDEEEADNYKPTKIISMHPHRERFALANERKGLGLPPFFRNRVYTRSPLAREFILEEDPATGELEWDWVIHHGVGVLGDERRDDSFFGQGRKCWACEGEECRWRRWGPEVKAQEEEMSDADRQILGELDMELEAQEEEELTDIERQLLGQMEMA